MKMFNIPLLSLLSLLSLLLMIKKSRISGFFRLQREMLTPNRYYASYDVGSGVEESNQTADLRQQPLRRR